MHSQSGDLVKKSARAVVLAAATMLAPGAASAQTIDSVATVSAATMRAVPPSRAMRTLRILAAQERAQRYISFGTYLTAGSLYLGGAAVLLSNARLQTDPVSFNVSIEMLVAGPVEILWGLYGLIFTGNFESMLRVAEREQASGVTGAALNERVLRRWRQSRDSERTWSRVYGIGGIVLGAATVGLGAYCLFVPPFNEHAVGLNATLGVALIAAGSLGGGYAAGVIASEPVSTAVLEALGDETTASALQNRRWISRPSVSVAASSNAALLTMSGSWM